MDEQIEAMLAQKRNRAIAIIMSVKEDECDEWLPQAARIALRKVVLDQVNGLHNMAHDLLRSTTDSVELNRIYLDRIDRIYDNVVTESNRDGEDG